MPYIKQADRDDLTKRNPKNAGELNYLLTTFIQEYFVENGGRYQQINDIIGALESCKLEFYRRVVSKYEDQKITENQDVMNIKINV